MGQFLYLRIGFLGLIGFGTLAFGQSVTLSLASGSGTAGGTVTVPISLTSTGEAQAVALQWSFGFSSDITGVTVASGASTTEAGKSLSCSGDNCLIFGLNSSVISDGPVAVATFQIAAHPSNNPISIQLTSVVAATAGGTAIPSSGTSGTISLPAAIALGSLNCTSSTINTPGSTSCSVALTGTASGSGFVVSLSSNNANLTVPSSVTVAYGQTSNTFTATGAQVSTNQTGVVTASAGGVNPTSTLSLVAPAQLSSLACAPSTLGSNASSTCTVTLNQAATSAATVLLASNIGLLTIPASVTVASGQSSATFTATSGTVSSSQNATITATLSGQSQQATISLAAAAQLSSLTCSPATVTGPGTSTCTATLTAAASNAASVTLLSNNTNVTVPGSVNIGAGLSSATFTATVAALTSNQTALLTATLNGGSQSFTLSAQGAPNRRPTSLFCSPSAMTSGVSAKCAVSLDAAATTDSVVSIASSSPLLSVPPSVTVPAGQSSATFNAISGSVSGSQNAIVTATLNGQSQQATITLAAAVNCQEFQTSPGGLCMIQDVFPWITFGGGWDSRLNAGNLSNGTGGGTIQFSFTLLPAVPSTGGVQNHMPAYFKDSLTGQTQVAENATYSLSAGESVAVDFLSPAAGCDIHGQNCGSLPDPNTSSYGSILVQYVAADPASLRGIAKAQLTLLANVANADYGWQTTESEMPAANLWTAPVSVSANQTANPQANQQASAALANPGLAAITVRGTLYDGSGNLVTFRDFQVPSLGAIALIFSQDPSQSFGGFGQAMFPLDQDFSGLVTFQVISPSGGSVSAMILQYVGNAVSSVELNSQNLPAASSSGTRCAEFTLAPDGTCTVQYMLPWVVFGGGWESRLKAGNPPSATSGAVQLRFTLLPAVSAANGLQNHRPAYFSDNRTGQLQVGESANYTLSANQSVDVHFLYSPAGCDGNGQNCASQPDPNTLSFGSVLVQYSSADPAFLRTLADPQLALLTRPSGESYSSQITERAAAAATVWTASVAMSANQNGDPQTHEAASAAIANSGAMPLTVRGTLRDQSGNAITYNDFQIPAAGAIGIVFAWEPAQSFGGFGSAAFPQGQDFNGWVTFDVTSPDNSAVTVLVLQDVGGTRSSVNVQSLP